MSRHLFVWDLHGTLEEGNDQAVVVLSNEVLKQFGRRERFTRQMGIDLYGLKWHEYFRHLIPAISDEEAYALQDACFKLSAEDTVDQLASIHPTPYAHEVLECIGQRFRQILVSNTRSETLPLFTRHLGLDRFFDESSRFAVNNHDDPGRTKAGTVMAVVTSGNFDGVVVVGDSESDRALATDVGAFFVLFGHPHLGKKDISADLKISDLRDIYPILDDLLAC